MIFIMKDKNRKGFHYKFTEEEIIMYNSIIVSAVIRSIMDRAIDQGYNLEDFKNKILPSEYIKNEFTKSVDIHLQEISKGRFDLDLFKYEDD